MRSDAPPSSNDRAIRYDKYRCDECVYLGSWQCTDAVPEGQVTHAADSPADMYYCTENEEPALVIRYSNEIGNELSGSGEELKRLIALHPEFREARQRAINKGLMPAGS